jgi:26S proteasome regulatory subunit N1
MLHVCAEHIDEKADHQAAAVLGIALVTLGEDVGSEMALRTYDHLLHYGGLPIRRAVPLGLALMNIRYTLLLLLLLLLLMLVCCC